MTSGHDDDGKMSWVDSVVWAAGLSFGGFNDWRLFNADPSCSTGFNCTGNELGHLFYNEFNLTANQSVASLFGGANANFNLFTNVQASFYWSGTEYAPRMDKSRAKILRNLLFSEIPDEFLFNSRIGRFKWLTNAILILILNASTNRQLRVDSNQSFQVLTYN